MPRIGIAGDALSGNTSGVGNYLLELLRHGAFDGYSATLYTKERHQQIAHMDGIDVKPVDPHSVFNAVPDPISHVWWENVAAGRAAVSDDVDLYFGSNYLVPLTFREKSVIVVHDLIHEMCPEYLPRSYVYYMKALLPRSIARADRVITVSESTKTDLVDIYDVESDAVSVAYGSASDRFSIDNIADTEGAIVREKYGIDGNFILYVGNLEPRKNVHTVIDALERLSPEQRPELAIAGQKFQGYPELSRSYEMSSCQDDITFLGYVDDEDLPSLYASARAFVFPSFYEGFGLPLLEAMKAGTPVVTSDRSSLPEVVGDTGKIVEPTSTEELAIAIRDLLSKPSNATLARQATDRAAKFSWDDAAATVSRTVDEVI
ncbi:Glycosyltransferase involved in cell wall bisynthesis [Halomicrobium zhouii]|uniref:Glycosyltransferase involved in cell wall bisynthesis n=1 Tax=Halomicrobium zhouii TaxID=767519 RepID=A0A1I6K8X9_9EURY|nr:glycosyltransferase family 1 protein [Halomicrobium zhouii]SFR87488.1 Glycosyltransferase involved in cell wall bisynthesis [Halomicrobium zhouii]